MTSLATMRRRLRSIARRRFLTRCCAAAAALTAAVAVALLVLFLLDRSFEMSRLQRIVSMASAAVAVYWGWQTYALPLLRQREDEVDIALLLERNGAWDRDLVAALQFDSARAAQLGSPALQQAVIEAVQADQSPPQPPGDGTAGKLLRRLAAAVLAVGLVAGVCLTVPEATTIFPHRLLLAEVYYPRDTAILAISVNGRELSQPPYAADVVVGEEVVVHVHAGGVLPATGALRVLGEQVDATFELAPLPRPDNDPGHYSATVPRLSEDVQAVVRLGDAPPLTIDLRILSPPTVSLQSSVVVPDYAQRLRGGHDDSLQFFNVPPGSKVDFQVVAIDKPLAKVTARINDNEHRLWATDGDDRRWEFVEPPAALQAVDQPVEITFKVRDHDGLPPAKPLAGRVGLLRDRPPQVEASALLRKVLPTARPIVEFTATDEFQLGSIAIHATINRSGDRVDEVKVIPQPLNAGADRRKVTGSHALELAPWNLQVGDRIEVVVVASDMRHGGAGEPVHSPAIVLEVAEMEAVMQAVRELDRAALENLEDIINRQLGVGAGP